MADPRLNVLVHPQQIALSVILATIVFLVEVNHRPEHCIDDEYG